MAARRILVSLIALLGSSLVLASPASAITDRDCGDFSSQKAAQIFYLKNGGPHSDPHGLDSEGDGVACESNPAPYYYGTSLPDEPKPEPEPQLVKTSLGLKLDTAKAIQGERVKLTATVSPTSGRTVLFQRRNDGRWRTFDRETSNRRGVATYAVRAPAADATYRAVVTKKESGNTIYSSATSDSRSLQVQHQRVVLDLARSWVAQGETTRATVRATPVRYRRPVLLQVRAGGTWHTFAEGRENRRGVESFPLGGKSLGEVRLRAVVGTWHGAVKESSNIESFEIRDVTPTAAPQGLAATPGDGLVDLTWNAVSAQDLDLYRVWYRTSVDGAWMHLGPTRSTTYSVAGLTNDTPYWFAVSTEDRAGNASGLSAAIEATPVAPVAPPEGE